MQLTAPTRQAIAAAQDLGVIVTLATGRSFHSAKSYARRLGLSAPLICANGALIRHWQGEILLETRLDPELSMLLVGEMEAAGLYIQVYHNDGILASAKNVGLSAWLEMICDNGASIRQLTYGIREYFRSRVKVTPALARDIGRGKVGAHKIFCAGGAEDLEPFQGRAQELGLTVDYYPGAKNHMYLEITPLGISKGWALAQLAGHLGIDLAGVAAIGDNLNDRTMIETAGLGIAMGNGHSQLVSIAGDVTLTNDEDGVAAALKRHVLAPAAKAV